MNQQLNWYVFLPRDVSPNVKSRSMDLIVIQWRSSIINIHLCAAKAEQEIVAHRIMTKLKEIKVVTSECDSS